MSALPYKPVSEEEIIDVLLGDADPALEARVRQAVRHDLKAAAIYAEWSQALPGLQQQATPLRQLNERVRDKVMKRLAEDPMAGMLVGDVIVLPRQPLAWLRMRMGTVLKLAAALVFAITCGPAFWNLLNPRLTAVTVSGGLVATRNGQRITLRPGTQVSLPVRLTAAPNAKAELRLADGSRVAVHGPTEMVLKGRRDIEQISGSSSFQVVHHWLWGRFTVQLPAGAVEDIGTAFETKISEGRGAVVRVTDGSVRVLPRRGAGIEAREGERALMDESSVTIEPLPVFDDLAKARAQYPTRLVRHGPAPAMAPIASIAPIPANAREVGYPSGALRLKAWFGMPPEGGTPRQALLPVVVVLHDGTGLETKDWAAAEPFRRAGFGVFMPMLRGENGNPGEHELLWGEADDAIAAGRAAAAIPGADPRRIYLAGTGRGGTLAMLAALLPSPYAGVYAADPLVDPAGLFGDPPFDSAEPHERILRTPAAFPDSLRIPLRIACAEGPRLEPARRFARAAGLLGKDCQVAGGPDAFAGATRFFQKK